MTHRIEKHITSQQFVMRVCKNQEGYLDWICHTSDDTLMKGKLNKKDGNFKPREMMKKAVVMLITKSMSKSDKFEKFIELAQDKGGFIYDGNVKGSVHKLLKRMLVRRAEDEYLLRIFIRKPRHRKQLFKLVSGYPNPMYPEHAMLRMNEALLKEERVAMRKEMRGLIDEDDNISPCPISSWLLPVLASSMEDMDGAEVDGYSVGVHPVKGVDSFSCLIQFISTEDESRVHHVTLDIKMAVDMNQLPKMHRFQHPYPHTAPYEKKGRQFIKDMNAAFQDGREALLLVSDMYKSAAGIRDSKKTRKPKQALTRLRLQQLERSKTAIYGRRRIEDKKVWTMDFGPVEVAVQREISQSENGFRRIEEALRLYRNLTVLPSQVVPPINDATQVALSLWLFKHSNERTKNLFPHFLALLHLVHGCLKGSFCPSFLQPACNTMSPKVSKSNPMGVDLKEVLSDLSDLDTDDEEGEGQGRTEEGLETNGEQEEEDLEAKTVIDVETTKSTKKNKKEKEVKLTADEKLEFLIELIQNGTLEELVDYINFH